MPDPGYALRFWAKTFPQDNEEAGAPPRFKPALHHLLDVGAVSLCFLQNSPNRLQREAALAGADPDVYITVVAFCAALHDLGKFSRPFQAKVPALWPADVLGTLPEVGIASRSHWRLTALLLCERQIGTLLSGCFPNLGPDAMGSIIAAIAGHHGRPPDSGEYNARPMLSQGHNDYIDIACLDAAREAARTIAGLIRPGCLPGVNEDNAGLFSWRLSGLITLADWVGSDAVYFGPEAPDTPLGVYWQNARHTARTALADKGLAPLPPADHPALDAFSPLAAKNPRPMQTKAGEIPLAKGAQLFIMEDATGSGKTEAAMLLAGRLMAAGHGEGIYFALPTMATANAIHRRVADASMAFFPHTGNQQGPSIVLAHGGADTARRLQRLQAASTGADQGSGAAAFCNEWIADNRRKAFFADIGAGTIDQAFLAILPKKHLTLRQYALAGRILIVDEAHCFDPYMQEELATLLTLHAANGGSAVVLSATLSQDMRRKLVIAFRNGFPDPSGKIAAPAVSGGLAPYPLVTHVHGDTASDLPMEITTDFHAPLRRSVAIVRLDDRQRAIDEALAAAGSGAAVAIICNAVDEAIAVYAALSDKFFKAHLFHARFAYGDRIRIENAVLNRFGRDAGEGERSGHILVATQVVEQSLDLDFDLVISDLAPIDLLIQRAGRLWRHMDMRPAESRPVPEPRLMIVSPDPASAHNAEWLTPALGAGAFVYRHAGVMWRSARTAFSRGIVHVPDDLRSMIDAVYGADAEDVPAGLDFAEGRGVAEGYAHRTLGQHNAIDLDAGYHGLGSGLSDEEEIATRLGQPTVTVRLARREGDELVPWARDAEDDRTLAWALSEIRIYASHWQNAHHPAADAALHEAARAEWPKFEERIHLAEIDTDGQLRVEGPQFRYYEIVGLTRVADVP